MTEPKNPYTSDPRFNDQDRALEAGTKALTAIAKACHANAEEKGFQSPPQDLATMSLNTIGEICEHWEAFRKKKLGDPCDKSEGMLDLFGETLTNEEEEVADQLIRVLDVAARFNIDIAKAVRIKHGFNRTRSHRHGGKVA